MSTRTSESACNDKVQRKWPACESFIDERSYKYTKNAKNLHSLSTSPTVYCYLIRTRIFYQCHFDIIQKLVLVPQNPSKDAGRPDVNVGPLTEQALRQLNKSNRPYSSEASPPMTLGTRSENSINSGLSDEPKNAVNADDPCFFEGLKERGIYFADDESDKDPSNIQELMKAVSAKRPNHAGPDGTAARNLRICARKALNESAMVQSVLPEIVPLPELWRANDISTTPDQKRHRMFMIRPDEPQLLAAPKPNRTIGWSESVFSAYPKAMRRLGIIMCPVAENARLAILLFTIEVEGPEGRSEVARLQNLHNGATMLANILDIWKLGLGDNTDGFFDKVHVMSLELTAQTLQLSCYWARKENGGIKFYGRLLNGWNLYDGKYPR